MADIPEKAGEPEGYELSLRRKEVMVASDAEPDEVEKEKRAAFPPTEAYLFRWLESERGTELLRTVTDARR